MVGVLDVFLPDIVEFFRRDNLSSEANDKKCMVPALSFVDMFSKYYSHLGHNILISLDLNFQVQSTYKVLLNKISSPAGCRACYEDDFRDMLSS